MVQRNTPKPTPAVVLLPAQHVRRLVFPLLVDHWTLLVDPTVQAPFSTLGTH